VLVYVSSEMSFYDLDNLDDPFDDDLFEVGNSNSTKKKTKAVEPAACSTWNELPIDHDSTLILEKQFLKDKEWIYADEDLGESFDGLGTQWAYPDTALVAEYKKRNIHKCGKPLKEVKTTIDHELPLGVSLYFLFLKSTLATLLWMIFFSIPSLILAYSGSRISFENRDIAGLYQLSISNIGFAESSLYNGHYCSENAIGSDAPEDICLSVIGYEISSQMICLIVSAFEILQIFAFFAGVRKLRKKYYELINVGTLTRRVSVTDYTVMVEDLPSDFTLEELVTYFSNLYQLSNKDFRGRLPIEDAKTVENCDNSGDLIFMNTWVADCRVVRAVGSYVSLAKQYEKKMWRLYINRAKMKMYGENTMREGGENRRRFLRCESAMLKTAARIDRLRQRILKPPRVRVINDNSFWKVALRQISASCASWRAECIHALRLKLSLNPPVVNVPVEAPAQQETKLDLNEEDDDDVLMKLPSSVKTPSVRNLVSSKSEAAGDALPPSSTLQFVENIQRGDGDDDGEAERAAAEAAILAAEAALPPDSREAFVKRLNSATPVAAFVTFQYNESMVRCLEDFNYYHSFPMNIGYTLCPPKNMLFKGRKLKVTQAPEPEEIFWENIEISFIKKLLLRVPSFLIITIVLAVFIYGLLWTSSSMRDFAVLIPDYEFCASIPQLYLGNETYAHQFHSMKFVRPVDSVEREILDYQCTAAFNSSIGFENVLFFYAQLKSSTNPPSVIVVNNSTNNVTSDDDFYSSVAYDNFYGGDKSDAIEPSLEELLANSTVEDLCSHNVALNTACPIADSIAAASELKSYCPCITTDEFKQIGANNDDNEAVTQAECQNFASAPKKTLPSAGLRMLRNKYEPSDVGLCYCRSALQDALETHGLLSILTKTNTLAGAASLSEAEHCEEVFFNFSQSTLMLWLSVLWTAVNATLIAYLVPVLVAAQRRFCQQDIEIAKFNILSVSYFLMMCLAILGSHGTVSLSSKNAVVVQILWSYGIFKGPFVDFTSEWFGSVGFYFAAVLILTTLLPMIGQCLRYFIVGPLFNKYCVLRSARYVIYDPLL
jgi:hypothetical protein